MASGGYSDPDEESPGSVVSGPSVWGVVVSDDGKVVLEPASATEIGVNAPSVTFTPQPMAPRDKRAVMRIVEKRVPRAVTFGA